MEDILEDLFNLKDCRIKFTTSDGEYEGTVALVTPQSNRIILEKVVLLPHNEKFCMLRFFTHEIKSYSLISQPTEQKKEEHRDLYCNPFNRYFGKDYSIQDKSDTESQQDLDECIEEEEEEFVLNLPKTFPYHLPLDNVVLNSINAEFQQAIDHIHRQLTIGVSFEGVGIGRHGKLNWLCVSTRFCTFLFDIFTLGKEAFENGLRKIMEDANIEKVIHDCRQPADCLHHQYNTHLANVFDTQMADVFVQNMNSKNKKLMTHVLSLAQCLMCYLPLSDRDVVMDFNLQYDKIKQFVLNLRPISSEYRDIFIINVIYLRALKAELFKLMTKPFHRAVEVYTNVLANASEQELGLEPSVPHLVPFALKAEELKFMDFKEFNIEPLGVASNFPQTAEHQKDVQKFIDRFSGKGSIEEEDTENTFSKPECLEEMKSKCALSERVVTDAVLSQILSNTESEKEDAKLEDSEETESDDQIWSLSRKTPKKQIEELSVDLDSLYVYNTQDTKENLVDSEETEMRTNFDCDLLYTDRTQDKSQPDYPEERRINGDISYFSIHTYKGVKKPWQHGSWPLTGKAWVKNTILRPG